MNEFIIERGTRLINIFVNIKFSQFGKGVRGKETIVLYYYLLRSRLVLNFIVFLRGIFLPC